MAGDRRPLRDRAHAVPTAVSPEMPQIRGGAVGVGYSQSHRVSSIHHTYLLLFSEILFSAAFIMYTELESGSRIEEQSRYTGVFRIWTRRAIPPRRLRVGGRTQRPKNEVTDCLRLVTIAFERASEGRGMFLRRVRIITIPTMTLVEVGHTGRLRSRFRG